MLQVQHDDYVSEDNRWWPAGLNCGFLGTNLTGELQTLQIPIRPDIWTNVWGKPAPQRMKGFLNVVQKTGNLNIVFGGGNRVALAPGALHAHVDPQNTLNQMPQLRRLVPAIANLRVIRTWSGVESYLPDDLPIIGPSAKVAGLYYAFGFCGAGFQVGPGVGDVMAELIDTGSTVTPIEPFHIGRFTTEQPAG